MGTPLPLPKKVAELPPKFSAHVCCGHTAGWIKMVLGMEVGLSPGDFMFDGDPAPSRIGAEPPICGPYLLRPNGCMDQDATWYGGRPRPRRHCVRWGPSSPSQKGAEPPPIFGPFLLWPNGWMHHDATWYGGRSQPRDFVFDGDPAPLPKKGRSLLPNFRPVSIVATVAHLSYC